jgi:hypothetical protein
VVFSKGRSIIEKSYRKETIQEDQDIREYALQVKGGRRELRQMVKSANKSHARNMAITTVEGVGLGALGIGMPDIVLFISAILRGVYETALHYGYDYIEREEQLLILKLMAASLATGEDWQQRNQEIDRIRTTLGDFYSAIKKEAYCERFVFITGVSKFCHVSLFSKLNNLTDITMDARYAAMFGYTQEELEDNFGDRITELAGEQDVETFKAQIKKWYNGYRFHKNAKTVYNPVSLAQFFEKSGEFNNYWFSTGTPSFLMELTKKTEFDFRSVIGGDSVPEIAFSAFEIDNIDPLALLLQTGYVTIKGTEERFGQTWYFLDFPNMEVTTAFSAYILNSYAGKTQTTGVRFAAEFATSLLNSDLKKLRKAMEVFFAGIPYDVHKKQESTFQGIFFSLFRLLGVYIEAESATNDGRIDAVVQTPQAIYLFEFKLDNDPTALEQIKAKEYFKKYLLDKRDIYIVGVNFDSVKGNLAGWEEEKIEK